MSNFEGGEPPLGHIHLPPNFTGLLDTPFRNFLEIFLKIHDIDLILNHPTVYQLKLYLSITNDNHAKTDQRNHILC